MPHDDLLLRNEVMLLKKEVEGLKDYLKQFRQTIVARQDRIENKVLLIEEEFMPGFESGEKIKRGEK